MKNIEFNTQICTTKEQSKMLLELGLKKETADMMYVVMIKDYKGRYIPEDEKHYDLCLFVQEYFQTVGFCEYDFIPAWSLHRLIAMLPDEIESLSVMLSHISYYHPVFGKNKIAYTDMEGWSHIFNKTDNIYDNIIDCIEWLIQNVYFNKEYLEEDKV